MAELKIDKKYIDEAVQSAVEDIKQNFVPLSVIEDIKAEIKDQMDDDDYFCGLSLALHILKASRRRPMEMMLTLKYRRCFRRLMM